MTQSNIPLPDVLLKQYEKNNVERVHFDVNPQADLEDIHDEIVAVEARFENYNALSREQKLELELLSAYRSIDQAHDLISTRVQCTIDEFMERKDNPDHQVLRELWGELS